MPQVIRLPDPSTWRFILVHNFIRHGLPQHVSNSRTVARSFLALHHGEAKPTLCISDPYLRDRVLRLGGWTEITAEVGPHTVKCWDEEHSRWKLDPEGLLPWERRPGEKLAPLPTEEVVDPPAEEVEIEGGEARPPVKREPRGAAAEAMRRKEEEGRAGGEAGKSEPPKGPPPGGKGAGGPTPRPRS